MARTQREILDSMKSKFNGKTPSGVDISFRQGSFMHLFSNPMASELSILENDYEDLFEKSFMENVTTLEEASLVGSRIGLVPKTDIKASGKVTFLGIDGTSIPINTKVQSSSSGFTYITIENGRVIGDDGTSGECTISISAEEAGETGNVIPDDITILPNEIVGVTSLTNRDHTFNGEDQESLDNFKNRYFELLRYPIQQDNKDYFAEKIKEAIPAVGYTKTIPIARGVGTFDVILTDLNNEPSSDAVVAEAQVILDEENLIGYDSLAKKADIFNVDVTANLELEATITVPTVELEIKKKIQEYLRGRFPRNIYISIIAIADAIKSVEGVVDVLSIEVNGLTTLTSIQLDITETAVLRNLTLI